MSVIRDYLLEIIIAIVSFFLLLLITLPYFLGYKIQSDYSHLINSISPDAGYSFEVTSFNRHWFKSDANLVVKDKDHKVLFEFKHKIVHGPIYLGLLLEGRSPFVNMVIKGDVVPEDIKHGSVFKLLGLTQKLQLKVYVGFGGDVVASLLVPEKKEDIEGVAFKIAQIDVVLNYFSDEKRFKGEITVPALTSYNKTLMELKRFTLNFDEVVSNDGVTGDIVLSFDMLKFTSKQSIYDFRKVSARLKNNKINNKMSLSVDVNGSKLNLFNEQVNSLSIGMSILNLGLEDIFDTVSIIDNELIFDNSFDLERYDYDSIEVKPFSFFSEHGNFSANIMMKKSKDILDARDVYITNKNTLADISLSTGLFIRIYEIIESNVDKPINKANIFARKLLKLKYIDNNLGKLKLKLSSTADDFLVNGHNIKFDKLSDNLINAVTSK